MIHLINKLESLLNRKCLFFRILTLSFIFVIPLIFSLEVIGINGLLFSFTLVVLAVLIDGELLGLHPRANRTKKIFQAQKQKLRTDKAVKYTEKLFKILLRTNNT